MSDINSPHPEVPVTARREVDPQSVEGLFLSVLALETPAERAAFLDQVCGEDAPRRRRIEALLRAYDDAGSFLEHPATPVGSAENFDFLEPADKPGCLGRLGYYEVIDVIGRGGMGIVFRALDPRLNRVVAVKVLAPELAANPLARRRFLREAQAAAAISHPHVVTIHAVDEAKLPYLVMECIVGQSLQQKLDHVGPLPLTEILRIGSQIAEGLAAAHRQGLIHRDIKPANILLENGVERVKITDFGLARAADDAAITRTGEVSGTPQYMSPEQARGDKVDSRSDLFSLGCVLYAMCTGRSPFRADSVAAAIRRVCDDMPRPIAEINAEIPVWLTDLIDILLAKQPEERFQTAEEVAAALERGLIRVQRPGEPVPPTVERSRRTIGPSGAETAAKTPAMATEERFPPAAVAVTQFLGQALFAGVLTLVATLIVLSQIAPLPDPGRFLLNVSGILVAVFLLAATRFWFLPTITPQPPIVISIAVQFANSYALWFGFLLGTALSGEWATEDANLFIGVAGTLGLSVLATVSVLLTRCDTATLDPSIIGRQLALLGVGVWGLLLAWFLGTAVGVLRAPAYAGMLSESIGAVAMLVVVAGGLLFAAGLFLQNRILGGANWLYVVRLLGLGLLLAGAGVAVLALLSAFGHAQGPGVFDLLRIAVPLVVAVLLYLWVRVATAAPRSARSASARPAPAEPRRLSPLWTALIIFGIVCIAPCVLGGLYLTLSHSTVEVRRPGSTETPELKVPADAARQLGQAGVPVELPPGTADGGMSGGSMMMPGTGPLPPRYDESQWGAILLDFGTIRGSQPGAMMGMGSGGALTHSIDRAVRLRPTDRQPGQSEQTDATVRKEGEAYLRAHPLTEPGVYRIDPGEYEVQLFDWSFGWAHGRDVVVTAPFTPQAPQRPAAVRSLGTIRVNPGEIVTVSATRDDVSALLRGIVATTPDMHKTQLAQFLWNGEMFVLSPMQARVVRSLLQRAAAGEAETTEAALRTGAGQKLAFTPKSDSGEPETQIVPADTPIEQVFNNGRHPAWGKLIVPGSQPDTFRLAPLILPQGTVPTVAVERQAQEQAPGQPADALRPEPVIPSSR